MHQSAPLQQIPKPIDMESLHQHYDVRNHMRALWQLGMNGSAQTEVGFRVDQAPQSAEGLSVIPQPMAHIYHHALFPISPNTVAEFHIHPNGTSARPSSEDTDIADRHKIDIYTFGQQGVFKYDWETKKTSRVSEGLEWLK